MDNCAHGHDARSFCDECEDTWARDHEIQEIKAQFLPALRKLVAVMETGTDHINKTTTKIYANDWYDVLSKSQYLIERYDELK